MKALMWGLVLVIAGAAGAVLNLWARHAFPDRWGGPNIGGGILQLLFYVLIVAGLVLAVVGGVVARRDR